MTAQPAPSAAVTERLAEHEGPPTFRADDDGWWWRCRCGALVFEDPDATMRPTEDRLDAHRAHIAAVLAPLVAEYAEARVAEALRPVRELADHWALVSRLDAFSEVMRFHMGMRADDLRAVLPDPADTGSGL